METAFILALIILTTILWFWAIIDINRSRFKSPTMNTVWLLIVLFFPVLGSIFYFQLRKKLITKGPRKFQPKFKRAEFQHH